MPEYSVASRAVSAVLQRPPEIWYSKSESALAKTPMVIIGALTRSTNNALLVRIGDPPGILAIYKPVRSARPLWDFDKNSLHRRERAAYLVARALGWCFVPPTIIRDGPLGEGAVQIYIPPVRAEQYFEFADDSRYSEELMRVCVFDFAINNADRKAGHCIIDKKGRLWVLDHGTCFHRDDKLRTVIWEFAGAPVPQRILEDVAAFEHDLERGESPSKVARQLENLLDLSEIAALKHRLHWLLESGRFPETLSEPPLPWPPI
ncbi:MAG: hypothetical protein C4318_07635 [Acidimicrobiia bacterium]